MESLSDSEFAALRARVDAEHDRRECVRLAPEVAAVPLEVALCTVRRERLYRKRSLKVPQYDYVRAVSVSVAGSNVGKYALSDGCFWDGTPSHRVATGDTSHYNHLGVVRRCDERGIVWFRASGERFARLFSARLRMEIDAVLAKLDANGIPIEWVGYEDGTTVPAGQIRGDAT